MKVSMNGLRRNLSNNVANLAEIVICLKEDLGSEDFNELCEAVNSVITDSNVLNCVFNPDDDTDFTDMSELEVDHIDIDE